MPVFTFSGKTASGEKVQGERAAANKDGLASQLAQRTHHAQFDPGEGQGILASHFWQRQGQGQGCRRILPPVLGHDRCRTAACPVSGDSWRQPGESEFPENPVGGADHRRRRLYARQRHAAVSRRVRRPDHEHGRGRRNRRHSRHHSAAPGHLRRKGCQAAFGSEVGVDLSGLGGHAWPC